VNKGTSFPLTRKGRQTQSGRKRDADGLTRKTKNVRFTILGRRASDEPAASAGGNGAEAKMTDYDTICSFENLLKAHYAARLGKRNKREVIEFEMNLAENICALQEQLAAREYTPRGYYRFSIYEPKERMIFAPHYSDRIVQHCLCDNVLRPTLEARLIYDNAACRIGKGTHFAIDRLSGFMREHFRNFGTDGYFLKCDIRKYFDNIDHTVLKAKLAKVFRERDLQKLIMGIIDSYGHTPGKGLPLGNQTSQWFALYYLDSLDRLIKEQLQIKHYTRYMDDFVLIHNEKAYLQNCKTEICRHCAEVLGLELNEKTQIFPLSSGVSYLGWHLYLSGTGKVVRKLLKPVKMRLSRRMSGLHRKYASGEIEFDAIKRSLVSTLGHLKHGNTYRLRKKVLSVPFIKASVAGVVE